VISDNFDKYEEEEDDPWDKAEDATPEVAVDVTPAAPCWVDPIYYIYSSYFDFK